MQALYLSNSKFNTRLTHENPKRLFTGFPDFLGSGMKCEDGVEITFDKANIVPAKRNHIYTDTFDNVVRPLREEGGGG